MPEHNGENADWRDGLPEDLKGSPTIKDIPDVETLVKNHIELTSHIGTMQRKPRADESQTSIDEYINKILVDDVSKDRLMVKPNFDDTKQSDDFFRSLGRPDNAEDYKLQTFEGITLDEGFVKATRAEARRLNLTNDQFQGYIAGQVETSNKAQADNKAAFEADHKGLRGDWGNNYDQNINLVGAFTEQSNAPTELKNVIEGGTADGETLKWLFGLAKNAGGETNTISNQQNSGQVDTSAELRLRMDALIEKVGELENADRMGNKNKVRALSNKILALRNQIAVQ